MPKSPSANKLLTATGLLCAIFAVSTPFWLFTSEQSVSVVNKNKVSATDSAAKADSKDKTQTADTKTESKDKAQVADADAKAESKDKDPAADIKSDNKDKAQAADAKSDSKDKAQGADAKSDNKDKAQAADAKSDSKDKAQGADAKSDNKDKAQAADAKADSKDKTQAANANADSKDKAQAADAKAESKDTAPAGDAKDESKDKAQGADAKAEEKDKAEGDAAQDSGKDSKSQAAGNESKEIADAKSKSSGEDKFATAAVEKADLSESVLAPGKEISQKPQSLADKVRDITRMRTAEDKAAYERAIKQREQQVDDAIASISGNYKIYLPNLFSEKAVVIYFSAPVSSTKINLRKDADLSKLKIDSLSGATVVKYQDPDTFEDVSEPAMDYIANTLSKESGAKLFKVATVTTYPDNVAKLYSMSFIELNELKYPELTDDVLLSIDKYSVVYLCYPNWWGNMPGAIYSFLAKYDLSDKIIVPVCLYEKDKFSGTTDTIATIEPNASVYSKGLLISKEECKNESKMRNKIRTFLTELSKDFE